jgi:hypothetical protein
MKRIYLVERTDSCGYDEYDAVVVVAETPKKAKEWVLKNDYWGMDKGKIICKLIGLTNKTQASGEVLASFNAG